jgi:hypothetical protein
MSESPTLCFRAPESIPVTIYVWLCEDEVEIFENVEYRKNVCSWTSYVLGELFENHHQALRFETGYGSSNYKFLAHRKS